VTGSTKVSALRWAGGVDGCLEVLDQTLLPLRVKHIRLRRVDEVFAAIRRLSVRGAPAIGIAAAYGVVLSLRAVRARSPEALAAVVERAAERLASARPTAVNLSAALERMRGAAREALARGAGRDDLREALLREAKALHAEDEALCRAIGEHGAALLEDGWGVLTHCNAGALATGGMGTALAVVYRAAEEGKKLRVFAGETRPLLQGARLTSWELQAAGIEVTLICDSAAASVLRQGHVQCVVVGADRIARNGDVANKVGTYAVAVLAREHGVPFYVAAPATTFDLGTPSGSHIPIEERSEAEVLESFGGRTAPRGVRAWNPAFDVTPARLVTAIISDRGVIRPPYPRNIPRVLGNSRGG
jgi:methylthioribose-1-phosphate isomerase